MSDNLLQIKQQAALWLVKQSQVDFNDHDNLFSWLNLSSRHQRIYDELAESWQTLGEISSLSTNQPAEKPRPSSVISVNFGKKTLAAAAAICGVAISLLSINSLDPTLYYQTTVAQPQSFTLSDGSTVLLNANSKMSIDITDQHRIITLVTGDAHFNVISDYQRPFVVNYQDHTFTALGTAFTVNTRPFVQLNVTEHQVKIDYQATSKIVREGYLTEFSSQWQPVTINESNIDWRQAKLTFNDRRLKDVLAQLQPYLSEKIYLMDPSLANEPVSGSVNLDKPYQALTLITQGMGLKLNIKNNLIRLM